MLRYEFTSGLSSCVRDGLTFQEVIWGSSVGFIKPLMLSEVNFCSWLKTDGVLRASETWHAWHPYPTPPGVVALVGPPLWGPHSCPSVSGALLLHLWLLASLFWPIQVTSGPGGVLVWFIHAFISYRGVTHLAGPPETQTLTWILEQACRDWTVPFVQGV